MILSNYKDNSLKVKMKSIITSPAADKKYIIIAGISGFLGVALGAFGAHGLKSVLSPAMLETFRTGVMYHLIHSAVIAALAVSAGQKFSKTILFMAAGILLFSFSLYIYSITGIKWLAVITPFGGVSFLIGWIMLIWEGIKTRPVE
jgi:uncharacterized membrane protein YgdD (TMEM256/DUF423 family)